MNNLFQGIFIPYKTEFYGTGVNYHNVKFLKDFGPWKKDEEITVLDFRFDSLTIFQYLLDGTKKSCQIKIVEK